MTAPMSAAEHLAAAEAKVLDAVLGDPCPTCGGRKLRMGEVVTGGGAFRDVGDVHDPAGIGGQTRHTPEVTNDGGTPPGGK